MGCNTCTAFARVQVTVTAPILAALIKGASYTPNITSYIIPFIYMEIKFCAECFRGVTNAQVRLILQ